MKDTTTTAFVIKGAVTHPRWPEFVQILKQGEIEAMEVVIQSADILEEVYADFDQEAFDHLVFAYNVAEPFGGLLVADTLFRGGYLPATVVRGVAFRALNLALAVSAPKTPVDSAEPEEADEDVGSLITANGMEVRCFGDWDVNSACLVIGDDGSEEGEFETMWTFGWPGGKTPENWDQVVEVITQWAKDNGYIVYELNAL